MSEREFEIYLGLLTRLLKLSPRQRQAIEQELRAHLEERLEDLMEKGYARDDAIAAALEEFGDAAGLADEFTRVARTTRRRRRIMQTSIGTLAAAAALALAFTFMLPEHRPGVPDQPRAQADAGPVVETRDVAVDESSLPDWLREASMTVTFDNTPLHEALRSVAESVEGDFFINQPVLLATLGDRGLAQPVTMRAAEADVVTVLSLLMEADERLTYHVVDDVLVITAASEPEPTITLKPYDVSDLLELEPAAARPATMQEITSVLAPSLGDRGNIGIYRYVLVVRATPAAHEQIKQTLDMLRLLRRDHLREARALRRERVEAAEREAQNERTGRPPQDHMTEEQ